MSHSHYLSAARLFYPQIDENGHCMGNSMIGAQELCSHNLKYVIRRLETIYYGARKPKTKNERIKLVDLQKLYNSLNDISADVMEDDDFSKSNLQQTSSIFKNIYDYFFLNKEDDIKEKSNEHKDPEMQEFFAAIDKFEKDFKVHNFTPPPNFGEYLTDSDYLPKSLSTVPENTPLLKLTDLKKQVMFAKEIQKTYLEKYGFEKLTSFHKHHPYIAELIEIDTFFSNIAIYQKPEQFTSLFPEQVRPHPDISSQAKLNQFILPILSPVNLDKKNEAGIVRLTEFSNRYSVANLQVLLNALALEIESQYVTRKKDFETKELSPPQEIPFALTVESYNHVICLGYDINNKKWIIIDTNIAFPSLVHKDSIGKVVVSAFLLYKMNISGRQTTAKLGYIPTTKEWIFMNGINKPNPSAHPQKELLAQAIIATGSLKTVEDLQANFGISVYSNAKSKAIMNRILNDWQASVAFKQANQFTEEKLHTKDDLGREFLLNFACTRNDIHTVKQLAKLSMREKFVDLNQINDTADKKDETTVLLDAVKFNHIEIVKILLEHKADPNILRYDQSSALFLAVNYNYIELVNVLIKAGAKIDFEWGGQTPLIYAIRENNFPLFQQLIQAKADINYQLKNKNIGITALLWAVQLGNINCVSTLIKMHADVDAQFKGQSVLYQAIEHDNPIIANEMAKILIDAKADVNFESSEGVSILAKAALEDRYLLLERVIEAKAHVNYQFKNDNIGATALFFAAQYGSLECAKRLIQANAVIDYELEGTSPLMAAINNKMNTVADLLIDAKADVNYMSREKNKGCTALYFAVQVGNAYCAKKLIECKADVNTVFRGTSAIMKSIKNDDIAITQLLIEAKADIPTEYIKKSTTNSAIQWIQNFNKNLVISAVDNAQAMDTKADKSNLNQKSFFSSGKKRKTLDGADTQKSPKRRK